MRQQGITSANRVAVMSVLWLECLSIVNRICFDRYRQDSGWGHSVIKQVWVLQNPIHFCLFYSGIQGYNWLCFPPTAHPPLLPFPKQIMLLSTRSPQWPWHSVLVRTSPLTCLSLKSSSVKNNINICCHFCLDDSTSISPSVTDTCPPVFIWPGWGSSILEDELWICMSRCYEPMQKLISKTWGNNSLYNYHFFKVGQNHKSWTREWDSQDAFPTSFAVDANTIVQK